MHKRSVFLCILSSFFSFVLSFIRQSNSSYFFVFAFIRKRIYCIISYRIVSRIISRIDTQFYMFLLNVIKVIHIIAARVYVRFFVAIASSSLFPISIYFDRTNSSSDFFTHTHQRLHSGILVLTD